MPLIPHLLYDRALASPRATALAVDGGETLTFGEWDARANALARGLVQKGVTEGDRVALSFDNDKWADFAVAYVAVLRAGAVAVPMGPGPRPTDVERLLLHCRAVGLVAPHEQPVPECVSWSASPAQLELGQPRDATPDLGHPDRLAEIIFSAAIMAPPRGVACRLGDLAAADSVPWAEHPAMMLHGFPLGSHAGQQALWRPLQGAGCSMVVPRFDPERIWALISEHRPTLLGLMPAAAAVVIESEPAEAAAASLRFLLLAGGPAPVSLLRRLSEALPKVTVVALDTLGPPGLVPNALAYDPAVPASPGRRVGGWELRVPDQANTATSVDTEGELYIRSTGPSGRSPYPLTDGAGAASPVAWTRTGVRGRIDATGSVHLTTSPCGAVESGNPHRFLLPLEAEDVLPGEVDHSGGAPLALSSQAGLVWREQLAPGCSNDPPFAQRLEGALDAGALEAALGEILRRHAVLRSGFEVVRGRAIQVVRPAAPFRLPVVDLTDLSPDARRAKVERAIGEAANRPVDLVCGPLFSPTLLRLSANDHVLVVPIHHSVWDDWSLGLLNRELSELYAAFAAGMPSPLGELALTFADFARDQSHDAGRPASADHRNWWKRQLTGAAFTLPLPIDDPERTEGSPQPGGAPVRLDLPSGLVRSIKALAREQRASVFMTMLSAFSVVMKHYTGVDDVLLPSGVANRNRTEFEEVIGCFLKAVPFRVDLSGDPPFVDLVNRVRDVVLATLSHQELPYETILRDVLGPPAVAHGIVTQPPVMFQSLNAPKSDLSLAGMRAFDLHGESSQSKRVNFVAGNQPGVALRRVWGMGLYRGTVLVVSVVESGPSLAVLAEGAFHRPAVTRLLAHYEAVLTDAVSDRHLPVSRLGRALRRGVMPQPGSSQGGPPTLLVAFEDHVGGDPDGLAIAADGSELTRAEVRARADRLARELRAAGAGAGTVVGVAATGAEAVVAVLGIWKAGGACLMLGPEGPGPPPGISGEAPLSMVVVGTGDAPRWLGLRGIPMVSEPIDGASPPAPPSWCSPPDGAAWVTTGLPGSPPLLLDHRALIDSAVGLAKELFPTAGLQERDRRRARLPPSPTDPAYLRQLSLALTFGWCLLIAGQGDVENGALVGLVGCGEVDVVDVTEPELWALLDAGLSEALEQRTSGPVPVIIVGFAEAPDAVTWWSLRDRAPGEVRLLWAPPEAGLAVTMIVVSEAGARPTVGRSLPHVRASVVGENGEPVPPGAVGLLRLHGAGGKGGPPGRSSGRLARSSADGRISVLGPVESWIYFRGFSVEPARMEAALADCPGVARVAVVLEGGAPTEHRLVAYVVPVDGTPAPSLNDLRRHLWCRLPGYIWPAAMVTVPALPGVKDHRLVEMESAAESLAPDAFVAPTTPAEKLLAHLWAEVLGLERVGVTDNYWVSFSFLEAVARARQAGLAITPRQVATNRTIQMLAMAVTVHQPETAVGAGAPARPPHPLPGAPAGGIPDQTGEERAAVDLAYWASRLAGSPPTLALPTDRPRPFALPYRVGTLHFEIPTRLASGVAAMSREGGTTPFVTILAAFVVVLARHAGGGDILVGSRGLPGGPDAGLLENLVLGTDLTDDPPFGEIVERLRVAVEEAEAHRGLSFERLVEELLLDSDVGRHPVVQVAFQWTDETAVPTEPAMLLELELWMSEADNGALAGSFRFAVELFDPLTVSRIANHLRRVLEQVVADPATPLSGIDLLTDSERQQLLSDWNNTDAPFVGQETILDLVGSQAAASPDAPAVIHGDQLLTYAELDARSSQLAHHLRDLGVGAGALVGLCVERSLEMVVGLLGILKAGGACVPLDPAYPRERLAFMLDDASVRVLVTQQRLIERIPASAALVFCLDDDWAAVACRPDARPEARVLPEQLAYVIYTSGSTGRPKGVMLAHRGLANHAVAMARLLGLRPADRILQFSSISFDISLEELFVTWVSGATLVLRPEDAAILGRGWLDWLQRQQVTVLDLPTAYWHEWVHDLSELGVVVPPSIRLVIVGGEKPSPRVFREWLEVGGDRVRWINTYGPTEASVTATSYEPSAEASPPGDLPIGRPLDNVRVYVLDHQGRPTPVGVVGELLIGGVGLAIGYLNQPDQTAEKFVVDGFSGQQGARLYRTGDLARYLADGNLEFLGRADRQVKLRGFRIELGEVESVLADHPAVGEAMVVDRDDARGNKRLVGYVVPRQGQNPTPRELRAHLAGRLPNWMVPSTVIVLQSFPLTPNGKVDHAVLPADNPLPGPQHGYVAPRDPVEETLAAVWAEVLDVDRVGVYDDFFDLGGHSLLATRMASRVRERLGVELPMRVVFESPTIADVAAAVSLQNVADPSHP